MKSIKIHLTGLAIIGGLIASLNFVHAQTTARAVQTVSTGKTAEMLEAVEETTPLPAESVPKFGTFYSARTPTGPPLPTSMGLPAWDLGSGTWLLDDLDQPQGKMRAMAGKIMALDVPSPGGGSDSGSNNYSGFSNSYTVPTNGLFLEITGVNNGVASFNLHNASNQVYAITSKSNLISADWKIEREVWPDTNQTVTPFTVPVLGRTSMLFIRAQDWTGVTENGNTTPDWWFWEYFGTTALSDTNLDSQGYTLLNDYQNGIDPNFIQFSLSVTNQYINNMSAPVQLNVTKGVPSYFAVLVDDTNFADVTWNTYTSSQITVYLGLAQGWHDVWVGLRGLPSNAMQTWQWKHLNLTLPPVLVITNPVTGVVNEPMIQIYGYCQDSLASISYDISNAVGVVTNQPSEITDQYYDTNACAFTTNYFECLDVPLTNGLNTITIHATNLAGDTTTTNFYFTLDYSSKTNPPVVQVTWPRNETQISGNNFTCRGVINDPTATVAAQVVFTNGNTNTFFGGIYTNTYVASVERNGNFWLENLPLNSGTNSFTITVKDAVGNTSVTNVCVFKSSFTFTVNLVTPDSQLWQPTVNLTGTISDPTYAVWVNGVKGHNNGDGTWFASSVPTSDGGTASFTATAYAPNEQQPDGSYGN
jgi:hypothetical protein